VDERLPRLTEILIPLLEHLQLAGIAPEAVTLICQPPSTGQAWAMELPDDFQDVHVEVHQPTDRRKLSYLATTQKNRRIYLNRSAVDADQLILLTGRNYDPRTGINGAETALFPGLSDEATCQEFVGKLSIAAPGNEPWPIRKEAAEVAWLLGAPFLLQVIEGAGDEVIHVLGGTVESSAEGDRLLNARWRVQVNGPADIIVAGISGDPHRHTFEDLARAFYCAARVVKPHGKIILLTEANPLLGRAGELMPQQKDPLNALKILLKENAPDLAAGFLWASAAEKAKLYLLSKIPGEIAKELFVTPLEDPSRVQELLGAEETVVVLGDAHKTMAVVAS